MGWQNFYDFKNKLLTPNHGNLYLNLKKKLDLKITVNMDALSMD